MTANLPNDQEEPNEKDLFDRVFKKSKKHDHGHRTVLFTDIETLIHSIRSLYPETAYVVVCDLDHRDSQGQPLLTQRKLRGLCFTHTRITYAFGVDYKTEGFWTEIFVFVENGRAYLKALKCSVNDDWK